MGAGERMPMEGHAHIARHVSDTRFEPTIIIEVPLWYPMT